MLKNHYDEIKYIIKRMLKSEQGIINQTGSRILTIKSIIDNSIDYIENCLNSITFSQKFLDGFNKEESSLMASIQANQRVYDEISDMIMDSWQKRSNSYDIISQKQSDATMGYERVYDTETGDIYKADLGFMDNDWNGRYEFVTDDMYNLPTSGYIERG